MENIIKHYQRDILPEIILLSSTDTHKHTQIASVLFVFHVTESLMKKEIQGLVLYLN